MPSQENDILDSNLTGSTAAEVKQLLFGRGIVSGLLLAGIFNRLFRRPDYFQPDLNWTFSLGVLLPTLIYGWWIYYNVRQIQAAKVGRKSPFHRSSIALSILIGLTYFYLNGTGLAGTGIRLASGPITHIGGMVGALLTCYDDLQLWRRA